MASPCMSATSCMAISAATPGSTSRSSGPRSTSPHASSRCAVNWAGRYCCRRTSSRAGKWSRHRSASFRSRVSLPSRNSSCPNLVQPFKAKAGGERSPPALPFRLPVLFLARPWLGLSTGLLGLPSLELPEQLFLVCVGGQLAVGGLLQESVESVVAGHGGFQSVRVQPLLGERQPLPAG